MMLHTADVESALSELAPKIPVIMRPRATYITMIETPYMQASAIDLERSLPFLRKKLTVIGIMGHTHGVKRATRPPRKQVRKIYSNDFPAISALLSFPSKSTGAHRSGTLLSALATAGAAVRVVSAAIFEVSAGASGVSAVSVTSAAGTASSFFSSFFASFTLAVPVNEKFSFEGGMQFWSLHAPKRMLASILNWGAVAVNF